MLAKISGVTGRGRLTGSHGVQVGEGRWGRGKDRPKGRVLTCSYVVSGAVKGFSIPLLLRVLTSCFHIPLVFLDIVLF